ncbi:unnamed protein product [Arctogadus glacialis]
MPPGELLVLLAWGARGNISLSHLTDGQRVGETGGHRRARLCVRTAAGCGCEEVTAVLLALTGQGRKTADRQQCPGSLVKQDTSETHEAFEKVYQTQKTQRETAGLSHGGSEHVVVSSVTEPRLQRVQTM